MVTTEAFENVSLIPPGVLLLGLAAAVVLALVGWALSKFDFGVSLLALAALIYLITMLGLLVNVFTESDYSNEVFSADLKEQVGISEVNRMGEDDARYWTGKDEDGKFVRFVVNELPEQKGTYKITYLD